MYFRSQLFSSLMVAFVYFRHHTSTIILCWHSYQRDHHDHAPQKSLGVVILNVFLPRFCGLLSCSPCGGRLRLEATLPSCVASVSGATVQMAFRSQQQCKHNIDTCSREHVAETKVIIFIRVHDCMIQCIGMFCAQIIDPSVSTLPRNLRRPIDQPNPSILQVSF